MKAVTERDREDSFKLMMFLGFTWADANKLNQVDRKFLLLRADVVKEEMEVHQAAAAAQSDKQSQELKEYTQAIQETQKTVGYMEGNLEGNYGPADMSQSPTETPGAGGPTLTEADPTEPGPQREMQPWGNSPA